jgi:hypothetical protein
MRISGHHRVERSSTAGVAPDGSRAGVPGVREGCPVNVPRYLIPELLLDALLRVGLFTLSQA